MIFSFEGNMRGGKSLNMTVLACRLSEMTGQPIYANYAIRWPQYHRFERWEDLKNITNAIVCFDEITTAMDSRNTKSHDQIYFTHLFSQMGKKGLTMLYTAQRPDMVEKRIRDQTDYVIECERLWPTSSLVATWWDTQKGRARQRYLNTYYIDNPKPFYRLYDSFEVVKSTAILV